MFSLASSSNNHKNHPQDDDPSRPPSSAFERRRSSLVALAKKINLFGGNATSTTEIVDTKDPEHARFRPLDGIPLGSMDSTSSIDSSNSSTRTASTSSASSAASTTGKERPHPPPLDTAAANNLPRHELNSAAPSSVTPAGSSDPSSRIKNGNNNAAGHSSPTAITTFSVGVAEDVNKKCRRSMEDTHAFVYDFHEPGSDSGYFAIFDGHAGRTAAEFCGKNFHNILSKQLRNAKPSVGVPEILDRTFVECDRELDKLTSESSRTSGCTAVVAYTRWEDRNVPDRNAMKERRKSGDTSDEARPTKVERRRVLYTGNVGDARIVLWYIISFFG